MRYTAYFRGAGYFSAKGWGTTNPNHGTRLMGGAEWEPPRYNSKLGYNSKFSYLESVWAGVMLWGCFHYNSTKKGGANENYNSSF